MKIIIETRVDINYALERSDKYIWIYNVNIEDIFNNWKIVLDKYSTIIHQMYSWDGVFINTIFSFLLKLKTESTSLQCKKLHTKLLERTKCFIKANDCLIYLYEANPDVKEYLEIECIDYLEFDNSKWLISSVKNNW